MFRTSLLLLVVVIGGVAGCGLFELDSAPRAVAEAFAKDPECSVDAGRANRVVRAVDGDGAEYELWLARTETGGQALAILIKEPEREPSGTALTCDPPDGGGAIMSFAGGSMSSGVGGREREWHVGSAPEGVEQVRADFGDELVVADVSADGYFVVARSTPADGDGMTASMSPSFVGLDGDGNVVP